VVEKEENGEEAMKKELRAVVERAMKEMAGSVKELRKWWTGKKDVEFLFNK